MSGLCFIPRHFPWINGWICRSICHEYLRGVQVLFELTDFPTASAPSFFRLQIFHPCYSFVFVRPVTQTIPIMFEGFEFVPQRSHGAMADNEDFGFPLIRIR